MRHTLLALLGLGLASVAHGQARISPQSIIVNPVPTALAVNVSVDRPGDNPAYAVGDPIRVTATVNQDAYVYLFSVHADGVIDLVLPNRYSGGENLVRAGERKSFPGANASFRFNLGGPAGQDKVLAVASRRQLNIDEIARFRGDGPLAVVAVKGQENLARALSIVVEKIPPADWVTAVAYYQVRGGAVAGAPAPVQTPAPAPVAESPNAPAPSTGVLFDRGSLGLGVYPGARLVGTVDRSPTDGKLEVEFATNASIADVANHYRNHVTARGWTLGRRIERGNTAELELQKGDQQVNLAITRGSQTYRLAIDYGTRILFQNGGVDLRVYPGARLLRTIDRAPNDGKLQIEFATNASVADIANHYRNHLQERGWRLASRADAGGVSTLEFRKGNDDRVKLTIRREGDRYRMEMEYSD